MLLETEAAVGAGLSEPAAVTAGLSSAHPSIRKRKSEAVPAPPMVGGRKSPSIPQWAQPLLEQKSKICLVQLLSEVNHIWYSLGISIAFLAITGGGGGVQLKFGWVLPSRLTGCLRAGVCVGGPPPGCLLYTSDAADE